MEQVTLRAKVPAARATPVQLARVAHVDSVPLYQQGVAAVLRRDPRTEWVGAASSAAAAVNLCKSAKPNVLLVDADADPGAHLCRLLSGLHPELVVVTLFRQSARSGGEVERARQAGARGFLPREIAPSRLPSALSAALENGFYIDPGISPLLKHSGHAKRTGTLLSRREQEVLGLIAEGMTAKRIGNRLGVSEETVKTHIRRILRKLEARDRAHAVARAFQAGVLPPR
ncbi:response regulator transcription factor [Allokutzneria sp. A3M-2-11 16]|uniref:response regulator transcription factor n=1 Tax=Allokutzneria sp. A3M-2-11 16 TaxID=2962043 RepID=UPI0020B742A9|nr:response regulator transcription factor [Allokutzneria sp. A3M-2-11 16]MCP3799075.1 response regulator transcription factor [Allokutzneria sp. A3M-2-11 16]